MWAIVDNSNLSDNGFCKRFANCKAPQKSAGQLDDIPRHHGFVFIGTSSTSIAQTR